MKKSSYNYILKLVMSLFKEQLITSTVSRMTIDIQYRIND